MAQIEFQYNETNTLIKCHEDETIEDICNKFITESKMNENEIKYYYDGKNLEDKKLAFNQMANPIDKTRKKMNIIVIKKEILSENPIVQAKQIICPKCHENIKMNINNFKINLFDCKNG